jgi:alkylated DNA repair dioxygenase AlkB
MELWAGEQETDLGAGAWMTYRPGWLSHDEADRLFARVKDEVVWEERAIVVAGRPILQPRLVGWAGAMPYRYSGQTLEPRAPGPALAALTEQVSAATGHTFNHVLLNRYRDGRDSIGFHADNEPELGRDPFVAAVSLGAERRFVIQRKGKRRGKPRTLRLAHGSLLVMGGTMQHHWYHAVPRERPPTAERINATFRILRGPPGWRGA